MQFYRYFKGHEKKGKWRSIAIERDEIQYVDDRNGFSTVLAVNERPERDVGISPNAMYKGPFYIDIDSADIKLSIKTAKKVLEKLRGFKIHDDEISIFASGKKGFHFTVPMEIFCDEEALPRLPWVYASIVRSMKLFELKEVDQTVYSAGKGRMWRIPNKKRDDNGQYKVQITANELAELDEKKYAELCSAARPLVAPVIHGKKNPTLQGLYNLALAKAAEQRRPKSTLIDQNLKDQLGDELVPPCVQMMVEGLSLKPDIGFNTRSVQMNKALRAFVPDAEQERFIDKFVNSNEGETYNTPELRREHLNRGRRTVQGGADYEWSCRSILSILSIAPCSACSICFIKEDQDAEYAAEEKVSLRELAQRAIDADKLTRGEVEPVPTVSEPVPPVKEEVKPSQNKLVATGRPIASDLDDMEGLTFNDEGYGFASAGGGIRRVSNFVLRFTKVYYEYIPNLEEERRVSTYAEVYVGSKKVGGVNIEDSVWESKAAFNSVFRGLANCAFYGKDDDVIKMKGTLMIGIDNEAARIRRVHSSGIHHLLVGETDVFTYVEPGFSIDNFGNVDTYSLSGQSQAAPRLKTVQSLELGKGDDVTTRLLLNLFQVNVSENVARILGWIMGCFLKQHIFSFRNEFPLLAVWGKAGAGKTATSGLFSALHGTGYLGGGGMDSPLSLGGEASSNFALWNFISSSMTVPRLIEEYNKKNLGKKYDIYSEYFKECWNQHSVKRGTIRNQKHHGGGAIDASTIDIPMTGPCLIISEQSLEVPALKQRTVEVQMHDQQRMSPEGRKAWSIVSPRWRGFNKLARTAYIEAVNTPVSQVQDWLLEFDEQIPSTMGARPHFSFCVLGMGLKFLASISNKYALGVGDEVDKLIKDLVNYANENAAEITVDKTRTEVDLIMGVISYMVRISTGNSGNSGEQQLRDWLPRQHYKRTGNVLLIDSHVAHSQYIAFQVSQHKSIAIESHNQFIQLLRSEDYCDNAAYVDPDGFARGRPVVKMNLLRLSERGIEVSVFEENS